MATLREPDGRTLTQYLYPYARNGSLAEPLVYTPAGQRRLGAEVGSGWWTADPSLPQALRRLGLPATQRPGAPAFPVRPFVAGLGVLAILVGSVAVWERRRIRPRTSLAGGV